MSGPAIAARVKDVFVADVPPQAAAAIIFIWIASFLDYYLTVFQVAHGGLELNPILAPFFHHLEYQKALLVKTALTFPGICVLSAFFRHAIAMRAIYGILVVYACLLVYHAFNIIV